jgi:hypothetical protein
VRRDPRRHRDDEGRVRAGLRYNPASPFLVAAGVVLVVRAVVGRLTDRWVNLAVHRPRLVVGDGGAPHRGSG